LFDVAVGQAVGLSYGEAVEDKQCAS
jgi:hypothetical protein